MDTPSIPAVIVGSAPSVSGLAPWHPEAPSTRRLARMVECSPADLGRHFGLANLVGLSRERSSSSRSEMSEAAAAFRFVEGFRYVLAGSEVVRAFGRRALPRPAEDDPRSWALTGGAPVLRWFTARCGATLAVLPHPSGRNRWYNLPGRTDLAARFLKGCRWLDRPGADELWRGGRRC